MLVPIFNSRLILQDIEYNKLATQEALYNYQKTVLEALEESENAIASLKHDQERLLHLNEAYQLNQNAVEFSQDLYQRGVHDNFVVAKAKQSLSTAEDAMVQSEVQLLLDYVALYKALGGSWDSSCILEE
jgi:outer membrane protein TolC